MGKRFAASLLVVAAAATVSGVGLDTGPAVLRPDPSGAAPRLASSGLLPAAGGGVGRVAVRNEGAGRASLLLELHASARGSITIVGEHGGVVYSGALHGLLRLRLGTIAPDEQLRFRVRLRDGSRPVALSGRWIAV